MVYAWYLPAAASLLLQPRKHIKSDNLQYNTLGRWDDRLIDQASDVPSVIFFHNFLQNSLQKPFQSFLIFL